MQAIFVWGRRLGAKDVVPVADCGVVSRSDEALLAAVGPAGKSSRCGFIVSVATVPWAGLVGNRDSHKQ